MDELSFGERLALVLSVFTVGALTLGPLLLGGWTLPNTTFSLFLEAALLLLIGAGNAFRVGEVGVEETYVVYPPVSNEAQRRLAEARRQQQGTSIVFLAAGFIVLGITGASAILQLVLV